MSSHKASLERAESAATFLASMRRPMSKTEIINGINDPEFRNVEGMSVYRWLMIAINQNMIQRVGEAKGTTYEPTRSFRAKYARKLLQIPATQRPKVPYNEDWLDRYIPNETFYLQPDSLERLHKRSPKGHAALAKISEKEIKAFMHDLTFASSRLEGNRYNYPDTVRLMEELVEAADGTPKDRVMLLNHAHAISEMLEWGAAVQAGTEQAKITPHLTRTYHAILSSDLMADSRDCGALRTTPITISQSSYIPPYMVSQIEECLTKIMDKAGAIKDHFERAFFMLVHIPYLQPFADCNKRLARVMCSLPLLEAGCMPMSWLDTPQGEYGDAMVSIYETNCTALLEELFVSGYMRATERFALTSKTADPSEMVVKYRVEIKRFIRAYILGEEPEVPAAVAEQDKQAFEEHIEREVMAISDQPFAAVRFGLKEEDAIAWRNKIRAEAGYEGV